MTKSRSNEPSNSEEHERYTPPLIVDALDCTFDLDPCSPGEGKSFVSAKHHYTINDDGLASKWFGTVFVNPPSGKHTGIWMRKLAEHGDGIGLVFARTDVRWFQDIAPKLSAVCFVAAKVKFFRGGMEEQYGTVGAGSMLLGFGNKSAEILRTSNLGVCFEYAAPLAWRSEL